MVQALGSRGAALHLNYSRWKEEQVNFSPLKERESTSSFSWTNPPAPDVWEESGSGAIKRRGERCSGVLTWNQPAS